ncbi:ParB N-terminal domain-containing protein [Pleomorphovibrio marinus]
MIKDHKFEKLVQSIVDDPEMLEMREVLVYPLKGLFVAIGGNMRLQACKHLKYKEIPCKVLDAKTPAKTIRAIIQKDNISFGEHNFDMIANEWDIEELEHWGMDLPVGWDEEDTGQSTPTQKNEIKLEIIFDQIDSYEEIRNEIEETISKYEGIILR